METRTKTRLEKWLALRPHSVQEVRDYLTRRLNQDEESAESIIAELQRNNLLSDRDFASWFLRQKYRHGKSLSLLLAQLRQKGVASELLRELEQETRDDDVLQIERAARLDELLRRELSRSHDEQKLIAKLLRRGYRYDEIRTARTELAESM